MAPLSERIKLCSDEMEMELGQFKFIPNYSERKMIPQMMSFREKKFQLERIHNKYCPDCEGGCPADVYLKEAESILKETGM